MLNNPLFKLLAMFFISLFVISESYSQSIIQIANVSDAIRADGIEILSKVDYYNIDIELLKQKLNTNGSVQLSIPRDNRLTTIDLQKVNILTSDYKLFTSSGATRESANDYTFYHGTIQGEKHSKVTMVYWADQVAISIMDQDGVYEINKLQDLYAGYYNRNRLSPTNLDWACTMVEDHAERPESSTAGNRSTTTPECVTVFVEVDYNMYLKQGSNVSTAESWVMNLFAQVAILYMEHNVPVNISGIQVWDTTDPYVSASNTSQALGLFRAEVYNNPNNNGRLAHLLSGRSLGGGIAYLNQLCSTSFNVAVSANMQSSSTPYPNYSWNVMVIAHEMGHNMGSSHTQACVWNGNNTAIDGCGAIEGSCADPGNPPNNVGGTIMSYCHLTSAGINLNNGFGPQPGALISDKYINASCETGDNCSFVSPFNDVCNRSKEIPVFNYCVNGYYENYATTPSGDGGAMSCGSTGVENDIWFKFDYGDVETVHISLQATASISDLVVELYSGDCSSLTSLDCGFSVGGGAASFILADPALANETVYIRVVEDGSDDEGEFSLCIYSDEVACQSDLDSLVNIYEDLDGANWTNKQGWEDGFLNGDCDYCDWYGVECNYLGQVIKLDLSDNNLQGELPKDISDLIYADSIDLSSNLLIDTIPDFWDSLDYCRYVDLSNNQFTGAIPTSFTTMSKINAIYLDYNSLDSIPLGLGYNSSLRTFTASNNLLEGCFVNGISSFCYKDSINLSNNPGLPYNGDVTNLCENGWGTDWDMDGYCNEIEDCNDFDDEVNPGADEVTCDAIDNNCDGTIDEGSNFGPNIWIGPDTLGIFDDATNWSLSHVPLLCENVEIGNGQDTIDLILLGNQDSDGGQSSYGELRIRDLLIGEHATVHLGDTTSLSIVGNGKLENNGHLILHGYANIDDQTGTNNTAWINNGELTIVGYGGFGIQEVGDYGLHNTATGVMHLFGYSNINVYNNPLAKSAIINEGIINIFGELYVSGTFTEEAIKNENGGMLDTKDGGSLYIYE